MQWIKEVEMVDSVDDLRSSSSVRGISMPTFEVLVRGKTETGWILQSETRGTRI